MKQVTVSSASGQVEVQLNNVNDSDKLTVKMAKSARNIAYGVGANATVSDNDDTFRVTRGGARKQALEW